MVQFEEFNDQKDEEKNQQALHANKKKLTIKIDESYDFVENCGESDRHHARTFQKSSGEYGESVATPMSDFELISPIENKDTAKFIRLLQDMQEIENNLAG